MQHLAIEPRSTHPTRSPRKDADASDGPVTTAAGLPGVQRTLLIPLWARAVETQKRRPVARDPRALELMESIDFDFSVFRRSYGTQIGCALRGLLYDAWVSAFLERHPHGTIVELGCGLTTRFERIDNGRARWIDVDLPEVIAVRRRYFEGSTRRALLSASVLADDWSKRIRAIADGPYFFVSEGMLMYLHQADVRRVLSHLADAFPGAEVALDSISRAVVHNQRHHDSMKHMMDVPFRWGIDDIRDIEQWDRRLRIGEIATLVDIAMRFPQRVPKRYRIAGGLVRAMVPRFERSYRLTTLRLAPTA